MTDPPVQAAGGLVLRPADGGYEILIVHRPRYDDWSLPKGKLDPGETPEQAAVREVEEETGVLAQIVRPAGQTRYRVADGEKLVHFYTMRALSDRPFHPNREVDEVRWVPLHAAPSLLSYERDAALVRRVEADGTVGTGRAFVVRHAHAGDRGRWQGDDRSRPLSETGQRQAEALVHALRNEGVARVLSSPYVRCRQTVEPLARALGLEVEESPQLAEGVAWSDVLELALVAAASNPVLCTHGDVVPSLVRGLGRRGVEIVSPGPAPEWGQASVWVLEVAGGEVVGASYRPPPAL